MKTLNENDVGNTNNSQHDEQQYNMLRLEWCKKHLFGQYNTKLKYGIKDNMFIIHGDVIIPNTCSALPYKIDKVYGNVVTENFLTQCSGNLITLKNFPTAIYGNFNCAFNEQLKSLEYGPEYVGGSYRCNNCGLTDLKGLAKTIEGSLIIYNNNIEDISPLYEHDISGIYDFDFNPCINSSIYKQIMNKRVL